MLDINRIFKNDRLMRAMTGLNLVAFERLLPSFRAVYEEAHSVLSNGGEPPGGGRKPILRH